ncbi:hypothetical protein THAOC_32155 [Thalassiosira oceanica]|uniref:Uncharacterized protein n=1 Tax=Thalassiosira oceanica TaxID=159749 RepID=K0RJC5_THAOC|nr:hypothetical protein THAOC_32155 [Thalassiosira oceanica]|eukprot:EJK49006.1 hypothetical protein THAOC_32155 [Thalassiosira oceanica]
MRTKGAWRSIKEGLAALPPFDTSNAQKPEPKFVVSGTTLVRVPANGISAKESDYSKPKEAREHVWMQKNWAPNLVFHNDEHVLDINDSGDVDKCAEVLSFLHKEYKESGKHHAGIAVADKFASAGYLVPSDSQ